MAAVGTAKRESSTWESDIIPSPRTSRSACPIYRFTVSKFNFYKRYGVLAGTAFICAIRVSDAVIQPYISVRVAPPGWSNRILSQENEPTRSRFALPT